MKLLFITTLFVSIAAAVSEAKLATAELKDNEQYRVTSVPGHNAPLQSANYAGYMPMSKDRKAYFYLIESENDPANDPFVLWLNGGPGCSSMLGMYTELGPFTFVNGGKIELNPFRWTTNATMLFLDSPAGVGFSNDPNIRTTVWTDDMAAEYNYEFLKNFFNQFPQFRKNTFQLAGESYAGHYVPQLAEKIYDGDDVQLKAQMRGWMVGNPCIGEIGCANNDPTLDPYMQYHGMQALNSKIPTASAEYDPYDILAPACVEKQALKMTRQFVKGNPHMQSKREKLFGISDTTALNAHAKLAAAAESGDAAKIAEAAVSVQSLHDLPPPPGRYDACAMDEMERHMNKPEVKAAIHANASYTYSGCSNTIRYPINRKGVVDIYKKIMDNTNWNILVFSGLEDSIVNFAQSQTIIDQMNLPLAKKSFSPWYYPDVYTNGATQLGGYYLQYERMAWAGVRGAGHMVPQSQPPAGKELFRSFLETGKPGRLANYITK